MKAASRPIAPPPGCRFHTRCPQRMDICASEELGSSMRAEHTVACHRVFGA